MCNYAYYEYFLTELLRPNCSPSMTHQGGAAHTLGIIGLDKGNALVWDVSFTA